ncbi:MAG TPA: hypothetical protein VJG90_05615 [Candidatus Nanoarchaeia archaeon]|nr:hypothetical protein [Candidatus Nanoarchaeia archaeon]
MIPEWQQGLLPNEVIAELPYYRRLERAYDEMMGLPGFPYSLCDAASYIVAQLTPLQEVAGFYDPGKTRHSWNFDSERGLWIDLVHQQFCEFAPSIAIFVVKASPQLRRSEKLTRLLGGETGKRRSLSVSERVKRNFGRHTPEINLDQIVLSLKSVGPV